MKLKNNEINGSMLWGLQPVEIADEDFSPDLFTKLMFAIPAYKGKVESPSISIERLLRRDYLKAELKAELVKANCKEMSDAFARKVIPDIKKRCLIQDIYLLSDLVDSCYFRELAKLGIVPRKLPGNLVQVIETDITLTNLPAGSTSICYKLSTKRELRLKSPGDDLTSVGDFKVKVKKDENE